MEESCVPFPLLVVPPPSSIPDLHIMLPIQLPNIPFKSIAHLQIYFILDGTLFFLAHHFRYMYKIIFVYFDYVEDIEKILNE